MVDQGDVGCWPALMECHPLALGRLLPEVPELTMIADDPPASASISARGLFENPLLIRIFRCGIRVESRWIAPGRSRVQSG